ncbi:MAG: HlyC/CorC family transporter [Proteobacteria bacterium]|nr:HlyC/CorC family transporter [Pseudomonadota bacterium]
MQLSLTSLLVILVCLILLSAFFAGSEIGMMSLNPYRLRHLVKKNNKTAIRVSELLAHPEKLLSVVLIGNTLANIVASMVATLIGQRLYGDLGVAIATLILTLVILVISEMAPKTLAALQPEKVAFAASLPLKIMQKIMAPLVMTISGITKLILRLFGIPLSKAEEALSNEELRSVVHETGSLLPVEHKSMLISLLDLERATVEDIMVPKADIIGIDLEEPWHILVEQLETAQHTRLPLYKGTIDNLVGLVHVRSLLNLALEERFNLDSLLKIAEPPYFIPEATPLNIQILNFQKMKKRICFVVDEYGDLQGLVTLEDILEEVVGEFTTDITDLSKDVIHQDDGSVIVDASITLRNLQRILNWQLPMIGPRTLSGLIIEYLGYIPPAECCLKIDNYQIEILKVSDNTIKTIRMAKTKK